MAQRWLKAYRSKLKITQDELAARLQVRGFEVTPGAISHWETGRYKPPLHDIEFRNALASILKISPQELLNAAGYETEFEHTEDGERAAVIIDSLPPDQRKLALNILQQFLERV